MNEIKTHIQIKKMYKLQIEKPYQLKELINFTH